jgi:DNA-binding transcriptional LysR family regulator
MDFDQLETFLQVARLSSFSRAAERRFRTQPAISAQIRALEEEVNVRLLDRTGGKVSVTAAGKVFLQFAEDLLQARRAMQIQLAELDRIPRGAIIIGANEATCLYILPEVFAEFKQQYAGVNITINRSEHSRILEQVIEQSADFGIVSLPVNDTRLTVVPIHKDELVVVTRPGHKLSAQSSATVAEIADYPLLLPQAGRTRDAIESALNERRLKPVISMELDSSELLKRFVAADVGIGFIARSNVLAEAGSGTLAVVNISDATFPRDLALVFRKDKALSRAALAFIEITVKHKPASALTRR